MKKLIYTLVAIFSLALIPFGQAQVDQSTSSVINTNTPLTVLTGRYQINSITLMGATNTTQVWVYDTAANATNFVNTNSYVTPTRYTTNYSIAYTNELGYVYTNTFSGLYTAFTTVAGSTNEAPHIMSVAVPANTIATFTLSHIFARGVTLYSNGSAVMAQLNYAGIP